MQLVDGNGKPTSTKEMLKEKTYRPGDTRDHQYNPAKVNTKATRRGVYEIVYLVYAPDIPGGNAQINIELPNKRQYMRVRWQIFFRRKILLFKSKFGEPNIVNTRNPYLISLTLEKTELSKNSKVELVSQDFKVN